MRNFDLKAELFVEQLLPNNEYEVIQVNNNYFLQISKTKETFLITIEAGGTKILTFECSCKTVWECNAIMIMIGNGKIKGLVACPYCGAIGVIEFIIPPRNILIDMFQIKETLMNEKWSLQKQQLQ